jgi:hypothetical protein
MIFARPSPTDLDDFPDALRALDGVTVLAPALVKATAYPLITYYGFGRDEAVRLGVHGFDISPALGLYTAYCLRRADSCGVTAFGRLKARARQALSGQAPAGAITGATRAISEVFDAPMDVVWGSRPDPDYLAITRAVSGAPAPCRGAGAGWLARLAEQLALFHAAGAGRLQECPYNLTLGYDRIVAGTGLQQADLAGVLAGRLVMVGAAIHASSDWVESPVHGQVPGVELHAMALDNLVEDGPDYRRNATTMVDSDLLKALLIGVLAFCGVLGVMTRNSLLDRAVAKHGVERLGAHIYGTLYVVLFGVSLGLVLLATWVGVTFAHRSPINWIGISACVLGFLAFATRETLPADVIGSIEHIGFVRRLIAAGRLLRRAMKFEEDRLLRRAPASFPPASDVDSGPSTAQDQGHGGS